MAVDVYPAVHVDWNATGCVVLPNACWAMQGCAQLTNMFLQHCTATQVLHCRVGFALPRKMVA